MFRFLVLGLSLLALIFAEERIIGGSDANIEQFPFLVSVHHESPENESEYDVICGGIILEKKLVLTTATCLRWFGKFIIRYGSSKYNSGGQTVNVVEKRPYDPDSLKLNLGLLILEEDIKFNEKAKPAVLPLSSEDEIPEGDEAEIAGWGWTSFPSEPSETLQKLSTPILNFTKCKEEFPDEVLGAMICAGRVEGKGPCLRDNGAPLVWKNRVYGILSGFDCRDNTPDFYIDIYFYKEWFNRTMNDIYLY